MKTFLISILCIFLVGCNLKTLRQTLLKTSPYEEYVLSLHRAGLREASLTKKWTQAGDRIFRDSILITLPFTESGFFEATTPQARGYCFNVKAGQVLTISGQTRSTNNAQVFTDLFVWEENKWKEIQYADSTIALQYEFEKDQRCLVRLQPELLSDVWYSITIRLNPVLLNPVKGATNKSIGSFYGNVRDHGNRKHEGIDIFAPRGTPVIAPSNGMVYGAGTNNLGGKVVWLYDSKRGLTYYFAHLDSQWVKTDLTIKKGDTIGQVGNTGNAIHTAPHLHFGIYQNGSRDPLPYVQTTPSIAEATPDTSMKAEIYKISVKEAPLLAGPEHKSRVLFKEPKDTYVKVLGKTNQWYRIALPNEQQAYIQRRDIQPLDKGKLIQLKFSDTLWSEAGEPRIPVMPLKISDKVELLALYQGQGYVRINQQFLGWIRYPL
jgi:peptidoglycan LD-endopeptidase LytH